jgi:hypothetical protein
MRAAAIGGIKWLFQQVSRLLGVFQVQDIIQLSHKRHTYQSALTFSFREDVVSSAAKGH